MFKFNFVEDDCDENATHEHPNNAPAITVETQTLAKPSGRVLDIAVHELPEALPPIISYSNLKIPISGKDANVTLARRDLYDVRYQLIAQEDGGEGNDDDTKGQPGTTPTIATEGNADLGYVDNPSDLAPGLYEGGLKTWECSLDLVDVLEGKVKAERGPGWLQGKRIIEIGCGTAVPSLYILQQLFNELPGSDGTTIVLQDFNDLVLRLVTFPNVFLAWYTSPLAANLRPTNEESPASDTEDVTVTITQSLKDEFLRSLEERKICIRFLAGAWDAILDAETFLEKPFDIVLTSETIYRIAELECLISLLRRACGASRTLDQEWQPEGAAKTGEERNCSMSGNLCLVAAKVLYFGVGGGLRDFEEAVHRHGGYTQVVLNHVNGVGRRVLTVNWVS